MKELLAAIALLCLSSTVLAHDIYSGFRDRNGHLCCNEKDCKPVHARVLPDGRYYLPASDETIPADIAQSSRGGGRKKIAAQGRSAVENPCEELMLAEAAAGNSPDEVGPVVCCAIGVVVAP